MNTFSPIQILVLALGLGLIASIIVILDLALSQAVQTAQIGPLGPLRVVLLFAAVLAVPAMATAHGALSEDENAARKGLIVILGCFVLLGLAVVVFQ